MVFFSFVTGFLRFDTSTPRKPRGGLLDAYPYERVGELRPGDADLELLERLELGGLIPRDERAEHPFATVDIVGQRPGGVEARRERPAALE